MASLLVKDEEPRVVGRSCPRHEALEKVTGAALYTDDLSIPNLVYGAILRSPYPHARILKIDAAKVEKMPGVLGILLPQDVPSRQFNCAGDVPSPLSIKDERILTNHPLYAGDRIAAIAALSESICRKAVEEIIVEYENLPAVFHIKDAMKRDAPSLHPDISESNIFKKIVASEGDLETGFEESDHVFEETFTTPPVHHVCLEPAGCICDYRSDGELLIWSTSQTPFQERRILSELLDLPENRIRIIKPTMGGGFGSRQQLHNQHVAALLSKKARRPVKIINSREEEMAGTPVRHGSECWLKVGVSKEGLLKAFHAMVYLNAGAYASHSPIVAAAQSRKMQYAVPHYKYEGYCVYTNTTVAGAWRGYGNPQLTFAREVLFDKIARTLDMDPVEFRMKNHLSVGDKIPGSPIEIRSCGIQACQEAAEEI